MSLDDRINKDYIQAMKDKDTVKSSALSYLRAMIKQVKVDKRLEVIDDNEVTAIIKKQIKQRQDSIEQFEKGGRQDLATKEKYEVDLMKAYLPAEMSADEIRVVVSAAVQELGATSMKDMGNVMKAVRDKVGAKADGKLVSEIVKEKLASL
ncbi:MAG: GatB/YqeY domain-containing protein [Candidatus Omnitrophica bacterium]|nr:GatB/YqeY domain-containing protein [Candidatus Omnitrophota bacterium]